MIRFIEKTNKSVTSADPAGTDAIGDATETAIVNVTIDVVVEREAVATVAVYHVIVRGAKEEEVTGRRFLAAVLRGTEFGMMIGVAGTAIGVKDGKG